MTSSWHEQRHWRHRWSDTEGVCLISKTLDTMWPNATAYSPRIACSKSRQYKLFSNVGVRSSRPTTSKTITAWKARSHIEGTKCGEWSALHLRWWFTWKRLVVRIEAPESTPWNGNSGTVIDLTTAIVKTCLKRVKPWHTSSSETADSTHRHAENDLSKAISLVHPLNLPVMHLTKFMLSCADMFSKANPNPD